MRTQSGFLLVCRKGYERKQANSFAEARELIKGILVQDPLKRLSLQQILGSAWFSKRIYPASPPGNDFTLPPISAADTDAAEVSRPPSIIMEHGRTSTSSNPPAERPITPVNHVNGLADEFIKPKSSEGELDASPSRPVYERRNSNASSAPPLPTRTPVRTKRRSVSSNISPPSTPKMRPSSMAIQVVEPVDFVGAMSRQTAVVFSTPQERGTLSALAALGFDTGQMVHSVLSNACDSSGALWWILRKKLGKNATIPEEQSDSALAVADPFFDSALSGKVALEAGVSEEEGDHALEVNGDRPTVLLDDVNELRKKKAHRAQREEQSAPREVVHQAPPEFAVVPATPIASEEVNIINTT